MEVNSTKLTMPKTLLKSVSFSSLSSKQKTIQLPSVIRVKNFIITSDNFNKYLLLNSPNNNDNQSINSKRNSCIHHTHIANSTCNLVLDKSSIRKYSSTKPIRKGDLALIDTNRSNSSLFRKSPSIVGEINTSGLKYKISNRYKYSIRDKCLFMKKQLEKKQRKIDNIMNQVLQLHGDEDNALRISMAKLSISHMKPFLFHN